MYRGDLYHMTQGVLETSNLGVPERAIPMPNGDDAKPFVGSHGPLMV